MQITVSSIYPEASINFPISWKFLKLLREKITEVSEEIALGFKATHAADYSLGIILSARDNSINLSIKGPSISKKYRCVDYVIYVPFSLLEHPESFFTAYVDCVCAGVLFIASKYSHSQKIPKKVANFKKSALGLRNELTYLL